MKVLIAYYSETGNTEKIARAIYDEASKDHDAHLKKIREITADKFNDYDLVFLGSACHSSDLAAPVKRILDGISKSPNFKLAGFFTHSTVLPDDSFDRARELYERWAGKCSKSFEKVSKEKPIEFKGYYHCMGAPSPEIERFIHRKILTSADEWEEYIKEARKHPTTEDIKRAKEFAREVLDEFHC